MVLQRLVLLTFISKSGIDLHDQMCDLGAHCASLPVWVKEKEKQFQGAFSSLVLVFCCLKILIQAPAAG